MMVHGKPRHPQSQSSVERLNCDVKDMLTALLGPITQQTGQWDFVLYISKRTAATILKSNNHLTKPSLERESKLDCVPIPFQQKFSRKMISEDDLIAAYATPPEDQETAESETSIPTENQETAEVEIATPPEDQETAESETSIPTENQ